MSNASPDTASAQIRVRRSQAMRESSVSLLVLSHFSVMWGNRTSVSRLFRPLREKPSQRTRW